MTMNRDIHPAIGARVETPDKAIGVIFELRPHTEPRDARVKCSDGGERWYRLSELRSGYKVRHHVQHAPPRGLALGPGTVQAVRVLGGFEQCLVQFFESGESRWLDWRLLKNAKPVEARIASRDIGRFDSPAERTRLRILAKALGIWNANTGAFGRLDIDPLPHQLDVARRVVTSSQARWLIADDVGLGKTIEVGLILHALTQRNRCRRVLVVCPASLTTQWKQEMRAKFGRAFEIYNRDFFPEYIDEMRLRDNVIISLDLAKRDEHTAMLMAAGQWDVVVFDEAHRLGRAESGEQTERYRLASRLNERTHALLLLTATPHQGKSKRFAALLELVRPDMMREIRSLEMNPEIVGDIIIRNPKSQVTDAEGRLIFRGHDTERHVIVPSPEMRDVATALDRYLREGYRASSDASNRALGRAIGFVMTTYRKLASSSLAALERALERRLTRLEEGGGETNPQMPSEEDIEADDSLSENAVILNATAFFEDETTHVRGVIARIRRARMADTKLTRFLEDVLAPLIARGENLLVFTEYRATQSYLAAAIARRFPSTTVAQIHGSLSLDEKTAAVRAFNARDAQVMVSTEAGGEGLNMQDACHVMVNYDLPWNPARLVQRIGRLYRYGQSRRVQVINLQADDGFDNAALALMLERVQTMAHDMAAVEGDGGEGLAADILGELMSNLDMENLLERATQMKFEQTEAEIGAALERARAAREAEADILQYASGYRTRVSGGFEGRHMVSFVKGMARFAGFEVRNELHGGKTLEIVLPEEAVSRWPEFGRRSVVRLTVDHARAVNDPGLVPMDFEAGFVRTLVDLANDRLKFDGLYGEAEGARFDGVISVHQVRWQDLSGEILEEDLLPLHSRDMDVNELDRQAFADLLAQPAQSGAEPAKGGQTDAAIARALEKAVDRALKSRGQADVMPASVFTAAALRLVQGPAPGGPTGR